MEKQSHPIRDKVIAGLIVAVIIAVLSYFVTIGAVAKWVANGLALLWNHLTSSIGLPRVLVYGVGLYIIFRIFKAIGAMIGAVPEQPRPDYAQYTQDTCEGMVWRWRYTSDYSGIADLQAYCATCDTLLSTESWVTFVQLVCEHCGQEYFLMTGGGGGSISLQSGLKGLEGRVRRLIDRKIRNNEWKALTVADSAGKTDNN